MGGLDAQAMTSGYVIEALMRCMEGVDARPKTFGDRGI